MFYIDYSDTVIKVGPMQPRKIPYQSSEELVRLISPIIRGSKVAIIIPESDIFVHRTHLISPSTDRFEIVRTILESSPLKDGNVIFSYKYITQTKELITYAMNREIYKTYLDLIKSCHATPESFIPQSALIFEALKGTLSGDEIILFIDCGTLSSELIVLDYYGPLGAFEEDIHEKNLLIQLPRILTHIKDVFHKKVSRIILSGDNIHTLQGKKDVFPLPISASSDYILVPHGYRKDALAYFNILALEKSYEALQQLNLLQDQSKDYSSSVKQNMLGIMGSIILLLTILFIINKEMQLRNTNITSPISKITPTSLPSPTPKIPNISDVSFEVLNGSGIEGQAQKVADLLKEKGVSKVTTANAEKYTYIKTVIHIKKEFSSLAAEIETLLKPKFELDQTDVLNSSASADIQIIVGK